MTTVDYKGIRITLGVYNILAHGLSYNEFLRYGVPPTNRAGHLDEDEPDLVHRQKRIEAVIKEAFSNRGTNVQVLVTVENDMELNMEAGEHIFTENDNPVKVLGSHITNEAMARTYTPRPMKIIVYTRNCEAKRILTPNSQ